MTLWKLRIITWKENSTVALRAQRTHHADSWKIKQPKILNTEKDAAK